MMRKYVDFFHDGTISSIEQKNDSLSFTLESGFIDSSEVSDTSILSIENTLRGKLTLKNIKSISVDNKAHQNPLYMDYDEGEILDLDIYSNKVEFLVDWINYPPKKRTRKTSKIIVQTNQVYWENIPDLEV